MSKEEKIALIIGAFSLGVPLINNKYYWARPFTKDTCKIDPEKMKFFLSRDYEDYSVCTNAEDN